MDGEPDALAKIAGIRLATAGIDAGDADLGAAEAFLNASDQVAADADDSVRMRTDDRQRLFRRHPSPSQRESAGYGGGVRVLRRGHLSPIP